MDSRTAVIGPKRKVADDELAVRRLEELQQKLDDGEVNIQDLIHQSGISYTSIFCAAHYPAMCTKRTYDGLAEILDWPEYEPGRRLSAESGQAGKKQMMIMFPPLEPEKHSQSSLSAQEIYDIRELAGMPIVNKLKVIAGVVHKDFREVVYKALAKYVSECGAILSYADNSGASCRK